MIIVYIYTSYVHAQSMQPAQAHFGTDRCYDDNIVRVMYRYMGMTFLICADGPSWTCPCHRSCRPFAIAVTRPRRGYPYPFRSHKLRRWRRRERRGSRWRTSVVVWVYTLLLYLQQCIAWRCGVRALYIDYIIYIMINLYYTQTSRFIHNIVECIL